jgi:hypothetical protein
MILCMHDSVCLHLTFCAAFPTLNCCCLCINLPWIFPSCPPLSCSHQKQPATSLAKSTHCQLLLLPFLLFLLSCHRQKGPAATLVAHSCLVLHQPAVCFCSTVAPTATKLTHHQLFPLFPSSLPHTHSSSSVATAENDLPLVLPHLTSTHCLLLFAVAPTAIRSTCCSLLLLLPSSLPHACSSSSPVAATEKDTLPVLHQLSDPCTYFILLLACHSNHHQLFPLLPSSLPHAHSSSSVTAAENNLLLVLPCLTSTHCLLSFAVAPTAIRSTCCSLLLLLPSSLPHACSSSSPVAAAKKDMLPVLHQLSDPCIYFILLLACCSNYHQLFPLFPSSLPHAHSSSSSVATAKNDLLPVLPHLALTHCLLSFAVAPTTVSHQPSDPCIYFILLLACCLNHCQLFPLSPFPLPHACSSSSSVATAEKDLLPVLCQPSCSIYRPFPFHMLSLPPPLSLLLKRTCHQSCINPVTHTSISLTILLSACCSNHCQSLSHSFYCLFPFLMLTPSPPQLLPPKMTCCQSCSSLLLCLATLTSTHMSVLFHMAI